MQKGILKTLLEKFAENGKNHKEPQNIKLTLNETFLKKIIYKISICIKHLKNQYILVYHENKIKLNWHKIIINTFIISLDLPILQIFMQKILYV